MNYMRSFLKKLKTLYGSMRMSNLSYKRKGIYPKHDWFVVFFCGVGVFLVLCVVALYFYLQIKDGKLFVKTINDSRGEVSINNTLLKKIVEGINLREESLVKINSGGLRRPDPSL